ncbi:MAG: hypothetical protein V7K89_01670 [Nostoc sp.]|uniref:hypothetical protein n=1 Tax=Nostoc sp. TaxID=1180 RepID=UPI002FFCB6F4
MSSSKSVRLCVILICDRSRSRSQFITIMNNLKLSYPQKMNAAVPANEYCGDFIPQESLDSATSSATDEE